MTKERCEAVTLGGHRCHLNVSEVAFMTGDKLCLTHWQKEKLGNYQNRKYKKEKKDATKSDE